MATQVNELPVRQERTGWRDGQLSQRHRAWGFNCPAVDLDFLMVEYNRGLPCAIVEYKHHGAKMPETFEHPTYTAVWELADRARLPFSVVVYWPETWAVRVHPVNERAMQFYKGVRYLTEREYVTSLYKLRGLAIRADIIETLNATRPPLSPADS